MGAIDDYSAYNGVKVTDASEEWHDAGLRPLKWAAIFGAPLTPRVSETLRAIVAVCHKPSETFATVEWAESPEITERLAVDVASVEGRAAYEDALRALIRHEFVRWRSGHVCPTYSGVVRAIGNEQWEWEQTLRRRREEWERPYTEFKRELDLGTVRGKEKLVRSCVAMANTIVEPTRLLIFGFDPVTHEFTTSVDSKALTQDRVESILTAYTASIPDVVVRTVRFDQGVAGVVEIRREARKLPYRVSRPIGGTEPGPLVRHGTHNESPGEAELSQLVREGLAAVGAGARDGQLAEIGPVAAADDLYEGDGQPEAGGFDAPMERLYRDELEIDGLADLDDRPGVTIHPVQMFVTPMLPPLPKRLQGLDGVVRTRFAKQAEQQRENLINAGRSENGQLWRLATSTPKSDADGWRRRIGEWEKRLRAFEAEWNWDEAEQLAEVLDRGESATNPETVPRPEWRARLTGRIDAGLAWLERHQVRP